MSSLPQAALPAGVGEAMGGAGGDSLALATAQKEASESRLLALKEERKLVVLRMAERALNDGGTIPQQVMDLFKDD